MTPNNDTQEPIADLVARIVKERSQTAARRVETTADVVSAARRGQMRWRPPTRLFPDAPPRRST